MTREPPTCAPLMIDDVEQCRVRGCTIRASHFVTWPTKTGASGSCRCRVHAREFADKYGVKFKEVSP